MSRQSQSSSLCRVRTISSVLTGMSGPATEALEQSLKRRRVSNADDEDNASVTSTDSSVCCSKHSSRSDEGQSPLFSLNDAFNAISSIEDENFADFPVIAWDFDDEDEP